MSNMISRVEPASPWAEQLLREKVEERLPGGIRLALTMYGIQFRIAGIMRLGAGNGRLDVMVHVVAPQVREFKQSVRLTVPEEWLQPKGGFEGVSEAI